MNRMILALAILVNLSAFAEGTSTTSTEASVAPTENKTTIPSSEVISTKEKKKGDIDDEITNARLRASTGSKAKTSFLSSFSYYGSSVTNPLSVTRPQLNDQNSEDVMKLTGQLAIKRRIDEHNSLSGGFGIAFVPSYMSKGVQKNEQTTASSPYLDYTLAFRGTGLQNVFDFQISKYTLAADLSSNLDYQTAISHQMLYGIKDSKFEIGLTTGYTQDIYNGSAPSPVMKSGQLVQTYIYSKVQVCPIIEYAFSEKLSVRTVYRWMTFTQNPVERANWKQASQTESLGVGYAITRDVYMYPNLQWAWGDLRPEATTVGMSAYINL
jgi:hypothetical protein